MGNASSSAGVSFGSLIGCILIAPITGGSSLVLATCAVGAGGGFVAAAAHGINNNPGTRTDFAVGVGCGAISAGCAAGPAIGAETTYCIGTAIGGQIVGVGYRSADNTGHKPKIFVGTPEQAAAYNRICTNFNERREEMIKLDVYEIIRKLGNTVTDIGRLPGFTSDRKAFSAVKRMSDTKYAIFMMIDGITPKRTPDQWRELHRTDTIWNKILEVFVYLVNTLISVHELASYDMRGIGPTLEIIDHEIKHNVHELIESLKRLGGQDKVIREIRDYYALPC